MFYVEPLVASIGVALYTPQLFIVPYMQSIMNRLAQKKALEVRKLGNFIVDTPEDDILRAAPRNGSPASLKPSCHCAPALS